MLLYLKAMLPIEIFFYLPPPSPMFFLFFFYPHSTGHSFNPSDFHVKLQLLRTTYLQMSTTPCFLFPLKNPSNILSPPSLPLPISDYCCCCCCCLLFKPLSLSLSDSASVFDTSLSHHHNLFHLRNSFLISHGWTMIQT
uniref:Uncharacterized protein n=1 Tax=Octopus bimaculoides TaxID=37653 RepID=A0A0L8FIM1_OCTBM